MKTFDFGAGAILIGLIIGLLLATKTDVFKTEPVPTPEGVYGYEDTFNPKTIRRWPNDDVWCRPWDAPWVCDRWRR